MKVCPFFVESKSWGTQQDVLQSLNLSKTRNLELGDLASQLLGNLASQFYYPRNPQTAKQHEWEILLWTHCSWGSCFDVLWLCGLLVFEQPLHDNDTSHIESTVYLWIHVDSQHVFLLEEVVSWITAATVAIAMFSWSIGDAKQGAIHCLQTV